MISKELKEFLKNLNLNDREIDALDMYAEASNVSIEKIIANAIHKQMEALFSNPFEEIRKARESRKFYQEALKAREPAEEPKKEEPKRFVPPVSNIKPVTHALVKKDENIVIADTKLEQIIPVKPAKKQVSTQMVEDKVDEIAEFIHNNDKKYTSAELLAHFWSKNEFDMMNTSSINYVLGTKHQDMFVKNRSYSFNDKHNANLWTLREDYVRQRWAVIITPSATEVPKAEEKKPESRPAPAPSAPKLSKCPKNFFSDSNLAGNKVLYEELRTCAKTCDVIDRDKIIRTFTDVYFEQSIKSVLDEYLDILVAKRVLKKNHKSRNYQVSRDGRAILKF